MTTVCHLLGARGTVGDILRDALEQAPGVRVEVWSGQPGSRSYSAFLAQWPTTSAADTVVVIAGGRSRGKVTELCEGHVTRVARVIDCFSSTRWPAAVLHLGSAAELVPTSVYGAVKAAQRQLLQAACQAHATGFVSLRLHSMVPERRPDRGVFAELLEQWEAGGDVSVHHLGGARDYLTAAQMATVCATLVAHCDHWNTRPPITLDLGNGTPVTVSDWLDAFTAAFERRPVVNERVPGFVDPQIVANPAPLKSLLEGCDPEAARRYDAARPDLEATIRRWQALG